MKRAEIMLRKLQDLERRGQVRLHLPASAGDLLQLTNVHRKCPRLLQEFYAMTNGLEADGVKLWSIWGNLAAQDRADGAIPIGRIGRPGIRGDLSLGPGGEVRCDTGETVVQWRDIAAFLTEIL